MEEFFKGLGVVIFVLALVALLMTPIFLFSTENHYIITDGDWNTKLIIKAENGQDRTWIKGWEEISENITLYRFKSRSDGDFKRFIDKTGLIYKELPILEYLDNKEK